MGVNQSVNQTDNKCFTYICKFIDIQDRAIKFQHIQKYSILLCENVFSNGPGTIYIDGIHKNDIVIDKFCSYESKTPSDGQFIYIDGAVNSTIVQGSIIYGGNRSLETGMIYSYASESSISEINISNCIAKTFTAFKLSFYKMLKMSFCNIESSKATEIWLNIIYTPLIFERYNYINNSQNPTYFNGMFLVSQSIANISDSVFKRTR